MVFGLVEKKERNGGNILFMDLTRDSFGQITNFRRMSMEDLGEFGLDTNFKKAITVKDCY